MTPSDRARSAKPKRINNRTGKQEGAARGWRTRTQDTQEKGKDGGDLPYSDKPPPPSQAAAGAPPFNGHRRPRWEELEGAAASSLVLAAAEHLAGDTVAVLAALNSHAAALALAVGALELLHNADLCGARGRAAQVR